MTRLTKTLYGSVAALALVMVAGQGFAEETGDFNATLRGATIGIPLGAAPPPGVYADLLTFTGIDGRGTGQAAGTTVFGQAWSPALVWAPGWKFMGGSYTAAVIQPFFVVAAVSSDPSGPIAFNSGVPGNGGLATSNAWFENMHNTIFTQSLSWGLAPGWFGSLGFGIQGPDGSIYNGTLNQDYWTYSPKAALAYLGKDWHLAVNFDYDIHTASAGHTGTFAALQAAGVPGIAAMGVGYVSGQQAFVDWSATYHMGKWEMGPVGYFKWQTTADRPGNGFTCATIAIPCGNDTDIALGALVGYNFGPVNFQTWVTKSIYTRDDFGTGGLSVWTRMSFRLWGVDQPMYKKAISSNY
jgi:hypothetical protein